MLIGSLKLENEMTESHVYFDGDKEQAKAFQDKSDALVRAMEKAASNNCRPGHYLFFDVETAGIPDWKKPSEDPCQPHIVQLAAKLINAETRECVQSIDVIVKPDGWEITPELTAIHGITDDYARQVGIPEILAVAMFMGLQNSAAKPTRIAYNKTFDERIIRIGLKRYFAEDEQLIETFHEENKTSICAMRMAKSYLKAKNVKLIEAYEAIVGRPMSEKYKAHSAMGDVDATIELFFAMLEGGAELEDREIA